jgi:hypothetical protein
MNGTIVGYISVAFLIEALVEYLVVDYLGDRAKYAAALIGVGLAVGFRLDLVQELVGLEARVPYLGNVLTGLVLGRGSNFVNDFTDQFLRPSE